MSLTSILNTARSGLLAAQRSVEVTSNNVANAQTEGYSRQRVDTTGDIGIRLPNGEIGGGVKVITTSRARDQFLDASYRSAAGSAAGGRVRADALSRMETVIGEPSDTGLGASLDAFYGAWSDFSARPNAGGAASAVQATGARVAQQLNRVAQRLEELQTETRERLQASVDEVNSLATAVADLNRQIVGEEASGNSSNTLRDARDLKLDRLVQLTGADVFESKDGSSRVLLGGLTLVDGTQVQPLAAVSIGGSTEVTRASLITRPVQIGGELGALRQTSVVDIPALQDDFDSLARGLVDSVNTIHRQGVTWSGQPPVATAGGPFFADDFAFTSLGDPNRKAKGIRLSDAVAASSGAIAASAATAAGPGDGSIALQIAGLRTTSTFFFAADGSPRATEPSGTFLQRIATGVAFSTRAVSDRADVDEAIASQSDSRRQSVSGVSVDEELVRLIKFQQTYAAAARLITAADGMMQTLLDIR